MSTRKGGIADRRTYGISTKWESGVVNGTEGGDGRLSPTVVDMVSVPKGSAVPRGVQRTNFDRSS